MYLTNLECSSRGDKRFSAMYARVSVKGVEASIEEHYQLSKAFKKRGSDDLHYGNSIKSVKAMQRDRENELVGFKIGDKNFDKSYLTQWYKMLWLMYLIKNPELLNVISKYDTFSDMFRAYNTKNCQADIIKQVRYEGMMSLKKDCFELVDLLK